MAQPFNTRFFERYAAAALADLLGERYAHLVQADRPDLQDVPGGLGIEVTRAIAENRAASDDLINAMAGYPAAGSEAHTPYTYGQPEGEALTLSELTYWSLALPMKRILASKVRKVSSGFYGNFLDFGLYVFTRETLRPVEVELILMYMAELQRASSHRYRSLFLSHITALYACDLTTLTYRRLAISTDARSRYFAHAFRA